MTRIPPIGLCLIFLLSLAMVRPTIAQNRNVQLCGTTQFADSVVIDGTVKSESRLVIPSNWVQDAPTLYTLLGAGTFVRNRQPPFDHFIGGFTISNPSDSFLDNPGCDVNADIVEVDTIRHFYTGTAVLTCTGGPTFPFQVTLELNLLNCNDTAFLGEAAAAQSSQSRIAAGQAPNEYVAP